MHLYQVTEDLALDLLDDTATILASQRLLGHHAEVEGEEPVPVWLRRGRFGWYVQKGMVICGLLKVDKVDPDTLTMETALAMLERRGVVMGFKGSKATKMAKGKRTKAKISKAKGAKGAKGTKISTKTAKGAAKMKVAEGNADTDVAVKKTKRAKRGGDFDPLAGGGGGVGEGDVDVPSNSKAKRKSTSKASLSLTTKAKDAAEKPGPKGSRGRKAAPTEATTIPAPRRKSGYAIYLQEQMGAGMKMAAAAAQWKSLNVEQQEKYKLKGEAIST